jgi:DNA-binding transcriptional regulator YiaG
MAIEANAIIAMAMMQIRKIRRNVWRLEEEVFAVILAVSRVYSVRYFYF